MYLNSKLKIKGFSDKSKNCHVAKVSFFFPPSNEHGKSQKERDTLCFKGQAAV